MKKFFFFRSSSPSTENNKRSPPKVSSFEGDKSENSFQSLSKTRRQVLDMQSSGESPCLRRSVSSSAALHRFPTDVGNKNSHKPLDRHSSRCRTPTPERRLSRPKCFDSAATENAYVVNALGLCDSSDSSSFSSSNVSSLVLDRYIDGEQEFSVQKQRNYIESREDIVKRPPRIQSTAPTSPSNGMREKPKSHSFIEIKGGQLSSRSWVENSFGHESPRSLAKHVIERLSQSRALGKTSAEDLDPITIEDVYGGSLKKSQSSNEVPEFFIKNRDKYESLNYDKDVDLMRKLKEAEERIWSFSEELEKENFLVATGFGVPALVQTIRNLLEERLSMAHEVAAGLQFRIADREEVKLVKEELDSRTRRLEKEKTELQLSLEQEIDRRSSEWSLKLEKFQAEEHRLRERVRELAEQNVSLQRDVSSLSERQVEDRSKIVDSESQLKDVSLRMEEVSEDNQNLSENLTVLEEKYRAVEEDRACIKRNYEDKEKECKELHKCISRIFRTCSEQGNTIDGLRKSLNEAVGKMGCSTGNYEKHLSKMQLEQLRLTGVEHNLRKEVESYRLDVDTLRHENINLLHRLKENGNNEEGNPPSYRLDREILDRVRCIQSEGLSLLKESTVLSTKLVEYAKSKSTCALETKQCVESLQTGLDGQLVVESEMKVHSIKRRTESLRNSLQTISSVLDSKSKLAGEPNLHCFEDRREQSVEQSPEDALRSELKAETLLTCVLREKLYAKEIQMEQMQAELAAAVRGNDILRSEVQNTLDNLSCMTHKMKDLELQMIKKDESINRLEDDLEESRQESAIVRGILPKVSEERDMLWKDVKQYSETNMLMNSEINMLKKKIEALDEDILLKEGQITILKDTLGKPFDLLASPESVRKFRFD